MIEVVLGQARFGQFEVTCHLKSVLELGLALVLTKLLVLLNAEDARVFPLDV